MRSLGHHTFTRQHKQSTILPALVRHLVKPFLIVETKNGARDERQLLFRTGQTIAEQNWCCRQHYQHTSAHRHQTILGWMVEFDWKRGRAISGNFIDIEQFSFVCAMLSWRRQNSESYTFFFSVEADNNFPFDGSLNVDLNAIVRTRTMAYGEWR